MRQSSPQPHFKSELPAAEGSPGPAVKIAERMREQVGVPQRRTSTDHDPGLKLTGKTPARASSRYQREALLLLAESMPQKVWTSDAQGVKTYCNRRYLDFTGISSVAEMNIRWHECVHPEDRRLVRETWANALATGEPYTLSYRLRRHDGVYRHVLARAVPVRGDDGQIEQWLVTTTDIHEQAVAEELLRRTEKLAAAARIAASIAHEINNEVAAVTNALYLALQAKELSPSTRQYLKLADQELARIARATTQTLQFYKQSVAPALASLRELTAFPACGKTQPL
ncbi:MAG TPA: PAS domain-containing protein [Acidobacteriaceae bacterium]